MRLPTALLTLFYLVSLVVASPLDAYQRNTISIPLSRIFRGTTMEDVKAHPTTVSHKYHVTSRNYALNTGSPHSLSSRGPPYKLGERNTGSLTGDENYVPLKNQPKSANLWYGSMAVGDPPESFTVQIDTGSADLFLCSVRCGLSRVGHQRYNARSSATSLDLCTPFVVKYGNRTEMSGDEYTDVVELAGYNFTRFARRQIAIKLCCPFNAHSHQAINQTLGVADYPDFAASNAPNGLAGLAFQEISSYGAAPFFQTLADSYVLHKSVFGVSLSSQKDKTLLRLSWSRSKDTGRFNSMGSPGMERITDKAQAIVDVGTAFIVTKPENAVKYYKDIKGARVVEEIWTVPCDTIRSHAPTLTLGGRLFPVSSSTFNLGPVHEGSTDCIAGLTGMPGNPG
ncbi:acid protease [Suillus weaverae]|nr:acid protease [Suillus weaverae]